MSEHNYLGLAFKAERDKHPQDFTITDAQIAANETKQAERRAIEDKTNFKPSEPRKEYNALRRELYDLTEAAKNAEVIVNNEAGNVRHFETIVSDLLKKKKTAIAEDRLGDERALEYQLVKAEDELLNTRERLIKWQHNNKECMRKLRNFAGHARLRGLKKELGL